MKLHKFDTDTAREYVARLQDEDIDTESSAAFRLGSRLKALWKRNCSERCNVARWESPVIGDIQPTLVAPIGFANEVMRGMRCQNRSGIWTFVCNEPGMYAVHAHVMFRIATPNSSVNLSLGLLRNQGKYNILQTAFGLGAQYVSLQGSDILPLDCGDTLQVGLSMLTVLGSTPVMPIMASQITSLYGYVSLNWIGQCCPCGTSTAWIHTAPEPLNEIPPEGV